jgi:predicted dehydrogenase
VLFASLKNIPGLHFQAVCDISTGTARRASIQVNAHQGTEPKGYSDIDEMLATEKGLDAAIVATPDFWHSPHTVKCLEAGLHVYCEKMMSTPSTARARWSAPWKNPANSARSATSAAATRATATPYDQLINGRKICGQITNANAQWNRSLGASQDIGGKKNSQEASSSRRRPQQYGFKDMHQFLNWRVYRDLSGGPISDLGAHQIDIFNWFLGSVPKRVSPPAAKSHFKEREHFDNVMCIFDYDTPQGEVRAFYQVLTTTSYGGGFWELHGHRGHHQDLGNRLQSSAILPRRRRSPVGRTGGARDISTQARAAQAPAIGRRGGILRIRPTGGIRPARRLQQARPPAAP